MLELSVNNIIILITAIISIIGFQGNNNLIDKLIFWPNRIKEKPKEIYRFVTSGLIHADVIHMIFNLLTLYYFGKYVEMILGSFQYLIFYILALIVSHITTYLKYKNQWQYRSLGASGAVSAVLFAFIFYAPWVNIYLFGILPLPAIIYAVAFLFLTFYLSKKNAGNINHDAHLWGSLFGWIYIVIFIDERHGMTFIENLMRF